jgi:RNA-directed DNA polymerase
LEEVHSASTPAESRALPNRRARIPKDDGRERLLRIPALEDKVVQRAVVTVLNHICEEEFFGFSYGFRPGPNPHRKPDAMIVGLTKRTVQC